MKFFLKFIRSSLIMGAVFLLTACSADYFANDPDDLDYVGDTANVYLYVDAETLPEDAAFSTQSLAEAFSRVAPGGEILVLPGTYHISLEYESLDFAAAPVTIRPFSAGGVVFDGQREDTFALYCENCKGLRIQGIEFKNYTDFALGFERSADIVLENLVVHHSGFAVQLDDWELEGYGIYIDTCEDFIVSNNLIYDNGPKPRAFGVLGTGVDMYACQHCEISDNEIYDTAGGGILVEDSVDVKVLNNYVHDNDLDATEDDWWDGGLWLDGGQDILVQGNIFENNIGPGIEISDEDNQSPSGYRIIDNEFRGNIYGLFIWNFGGMPGTDILELSGNTYEGHIKDIFLIEWMDDVDSLERP